MGDAFSFAGVDDLRGTSRVPHFCLHGGGRYLPAARAARKVLDIERFTFDKIKHTFEETFGIPIDIRTTMIYD